MNGISLSKPEGWVDRSMIAYALPEDPSRAVAPNLVITLSPFGTMPGKTVKDRIGAFADRQVTEMKAGLPSLVIHLQQSCELCDREAVEVYLSWQSGRARVSQWVIFTARNADEVMISTVTAAEADFAEVHDQFRDELISRIKLD